MSTYKPVPYSQEVWSDEEMMLRCRLFRTQMEARRSVRMFSDAPVPQEVIEHIVMTAASAPSGANKQPWTFCVISDPALKKEIRLAAEKEERAFYEGRASEVWLKDLEPFGTDADKPFLETAPWLIVVFKQVHGPDKSPHYYVQESVGIACGFLIAAIHQAGLVTLTHTPSPMNFLQKILHRPDHERAFLLLPVGFPTSDATVPDIQKKSAGEVLAFY